MSFLSQPITLFPSNKRMIAGVSINVVLSESTTDTLTITKQPVQQGASITDHSYMEPTVLSMNVYFADNNGETLQSIYQDLLDLQSAREPITVVTLKRTYTSMLVATIGLTTDKNTENTLAIVISFQQVVLVPITTATVPRIRQKNPASTGATDPAGKKSALLTLKEGIGAAFSP